MVAKDVARLWEELRHRDPEEKLGWITQLAQNPSEDSIEVLLDVLQQESWFLRDQAARVLATMGEPVLGPLVEYLGSGLWYTRASAVTALGRMGNPRAAAPLVGMLNDPNRTVRDAVWDALLALCRNELATRELAQAFDALPERARRFALDGLLERDAEAAGQVVLYMEEPAQAQEIPAPEPREGDLSWKDVVGGEGEAKQAAR
ncbi:MAG: HEAT repeat domain-containing protein [Candidatus Eisenbacteria bacterium]|uniref:HEAT repeat domain-containing protein n=1 Tax=Eiseniibacteriota bacterium TaxID=2212470 RepID=A0A538SCJ9_UNCEI|nr:MAG: HEAT repeat domain-containing protein [Candidatus Eisenbacteria bacterium]